MCFPLSYIYMNPKRPDDGREFVDLMVVSPKHILLIHAKDSPNTEKTIERSMNRKKLRTLSHIQKAISQMRGSIRYLQASDTLQVIVGKNLRTFSVEDRQVLGLVVVTEMFDYEFQSYYILALDLIKDTGVPFFIMG